MEWNLKKFNELTADELYGIVKLRVEIFVIEQECIYQDLDDKDQCAFHLFLKDNESVIACLRILPENVSYDDMAIGRLVVSKNYRGQGIAREMMKKAMNFITEDLKKSKIRLSGQSYLEDFYKNLGFEKVSNEYLEDGIPHFEFFWQR